MFIPMLITLFSQGRGSVTWASWGRTRGSWFPKMLLKPAFGLMGGFDWWIFHWFPVSSFISLMHSMHPLTHSLIHPHLRLGLGKGTELLKNYPQDSWLWWSLVKSNHDLGHACLRCVSMCPILLTTVSPESSIINILDQLCWSTWIKEKDCLRDSLAGKGGGPFSWVAQAG